MVASRQRAGFIDEGLQPFRKGIRLRGGPWRDLPSSLRCASRAGMYSAMDTGTASARFVAA